MTEPESEPLPNGVIPFPGQGQSTGAQGTSPLHHLHPDRDRYWMTDDSAQVLMPQRGGKEMAWIPVTNFSAAIVGEVVIDDGAERRREYEVEASFRGHRKTLRIPERDFNKLDWVSRELHPQALYFPKLKEYAWVAIRIAGPEPWRREILAHTGWREVGGQWAYLHGGGAIGPDGPIPGIETELNGLGGYVLNAPKPGSESLVLAASLAMLEIAPLPLTAPLLAAVFRAPFGPADFAIHLFGQSGILKTELATLVQQHFGAGMHSRNLPESWMSSLAHIEPKLFGAKDAVLVIDDLKAEGSRQAVERIHAKAAEVFRAVGNLSMRGRARQDGSLRPDKAPRCVLVSTGEELPRGESVHARVLKLLVNEGDVDPRRLGNAQADAAAGLYAQAMALWVQHLARDLPAALAAFRAQRERLLPLVGGEHRRTPGIIAELGAGLRLFTEFARARGLRPAPWDRLWSALTWTGSAQAAYSEDEDPAKRFLALIGAVLSSGDGWLRPRPELSAPASGIPYGATTATGSGKCLGWQDSPVVLLEPEVAFAAAQQLARAQDRPLNITAIMLWKRLDAAGLIARKDADGRNTYRAQGGKRMIAVWAQDIGR